MIKCTGCPFKPFFLSLLELVERRLELLEILPPYISPTPMPVRIIRYPSTDGALAWVQRLTLQPYLSP